MKGFSRIFICLIFFAFAIESCHIHKRGARRQVAQKRGTVEGTVNIPDTSAHTPRTRAMPNPSPAPIPNPNPNPTSPNP